MKKQSLLALSYITSAAILLSSCQKDLQTNAADEVLGAPLPGQQTYCRIESVWEKLVTGEQLFRLVLYNEFENPIAITSPVLGTGNTYHEFKYDKWHRLKEHIGHMDHGQFQNWHFYGYDNSGRIGYDTTYWFGTLGEKPTNYWFREYATYEYDNQNRIVKVTGHNDQVSLGSITYAYDAAGNLIHPPSDGIEYDNKININRTNDIWMFLSRDYSVNNPFIANAYNSAGYPTIIGSARYNWAGTEISLSQSQFSYSCRQAYW